MKRLSVLASCLVLALAVPARPADAASKCSGSKCAKHKTTTSTKGRDSYTAEQRAKIMERARQVCQDKHGAPSRVYRVDYKRLRVWCMPASAG